MHYFLLFQTRRGHHKHENAAATVPARACRAGVRGKRVSKVTRPWSTVRKGFRLWRDGLLF